MREKHACCVQIRMRMGYVVILNTCSQYNKFTPWNMNVCNNNNICMYGDVKTPGQRVKLKQRQHMHPLKHQ